MNRYYDSPVHRREVYDYCYKKRSDCIGVWSSFSADIIKQAKNLMIERGHTYYQSRKLDRVPKEAVEEILGIKLPDEQNQ